MGRGWTDGGLSWLPFWDSYSLDRFYLLSRKAVLVLAGEGEECKSDPKNKDPKRATKTTLPPSILSQQTCQGRRTSES